MSTISHIDESQEGFVYTETRLANHDGLLAPSAIKAIVARLIHTDRPAVLELGAGRESHIPDGLHPSKVVGLGADEIALKQNTSLGEYLVHDLSQIPALPLSDETMDAVLCAAPIEAVAQMEAVFAEVARVLRSGGVFIVVLSNCYVKLWRQSNGEARLKRVRDTLYVVDEFARPRVLVREGNHKLSDTDGTAYAVYADKLAKPGEGPQSPQEASVHCPYSKEEIIERKGSVGGTLRCPYCDERLQKWIVPQTPFTEWPSEYQFVCLNDDCVQFALGWETMAAQEVPGSCRFMYEPVINGCYTISVLSRNDLRDGIVDDG